MKSYEGKRAYVTGGSSGIGRSLAAELVRRGAHVCISARGQERLDATTDHLRASASSGQVVTGLSVDIAQREAVERAAPVVLERLGGLDVLVNNAGISLVGEPENVAAVDYEETMAVNFFGTVNTTLSFLPHFRSQASGTIAFVSSTLGRMGLYGYSAYAASKFAIAGYADCLRQDLLPHGVHVSVAFPADTDTPQWHAENETKPDVTKALAGAARLARPDDVARAILDGMVRGHYRIVPGLNNALILWANDKMAWLPRRVIDSGLRKFFSRESG